MPPDGTVYLRLESRIDPAAVAPYIRISPHDWEPSLDWEQGTDNAGRDWAQAPLRLTGVEPGSTVQISFSPGLPLAAGGALDQEVSYMLQVAEPPSYRVAVDGPGLLRYGAAGAPTMIGEGTQVDLIAPGPATVTFDLDQPVDRAAAEQAVRLAFGERPPAQPRRFSRSGPAPPDWTCGGCRGTPGWC